MMKWRYGRKFSLAFVLLENINSLIREAKNRIKNNEFEFLFWRAVLGKVLTYTEAAESDIETLIDANAVLDIKREQEERETEELKRAQGKR